MGKLTYMIVALVVVDILFLITGQLGLDSATSLIANAIQDPSSIEVSTFWNAMIGGSTGIGTLVAATGVTVGALFGGTNVLVFLPLALVFAVLISDYISIYNSLASYNVVLATLIMVPVMMAYILYVIEWLRAKD